MIRKHSHHYLYRDGIYLHILVNGSIQNMTVLIHVCQNHYNLNLALCSYKGHFHLIVRV